MEIVSEPDMRSAAEAGAYLRILRTIIRWIDVGDGNMKRAAFAATPMSPSCPEGSDTLGTRTEIKNLNSFQECGKGDCSMKSPARPISCSTAAGSFRRPGSGIRPKTDRVHAQQGRGS
jgi:hypothetical protein